MAQPSFITAPTMPRPYGYSRADYPTPRDFGVDTFIRRNAARFDAGYGGKPIELRTVKDVERENDGEILDDLEDTFH